MRAVDVAWVEIRSRIADVERMGRDEEGGSARIMAVLGEKLWWMIWDSTTY